MNEREKKCVQQEYITRTINAGAPSCSFNPTYRMQVAPLDEELVLRATFKSRLATRQRTISHRRDLVKELSTMSGAIEDFAATCRQVQNSRSTFDRVSTR